MDRAKDFLHSMGEEILNFMDKHDSHITPDKVTYLAAMCDDYSKICEFVEFHRDHKDGSLYGHHWQKQVTPGTPGEALFDNPRPRKR